ncbi:MAG TPA: polysaccharide biosynthesis/export family protein [Mucilaginibacter sp.]|nr:polysaccharide biosynthesis/export family protein [Mucilaginibacter sp.]
MRRYSIKFVGLLAATLYLSFSMFSCNTTKKIKYFQDIPDSGQMKTIPVASYAPPTIQTDDILTILIQTIDPGATESVNLGNVPTANTGSVIGSTSLSQQVTSGYLVNKDGFVEMPVLGRIKLLGYTTDEARDIVTKRAELFFQNPTVIVRFANFKVSVTGEVQKPGQYVMPNERVSILDAIAMAGDLTIFGKRENVLLLRENGDGSTTPYRINLKKSDIMTLPCYYLRQNDVIYVEPRKSKSDATDASQAKYITIAGSILSILLVIATRRL